MRLTASLRKYVPDWYNLKKTSGSYFKKQNLFRMTRFYKNIGWSTHKNAMNRFHYFLKGEMWWGPVKRRERIEVNLARIAAGCEEHGLKYQYFVKTLPKLDIGINASCLARLAIYEPRTFKSLVEIVKQATADEVPKQNFDPKAL